MSDAIFRALLSRFAMPEWLLVPQVRDAAGFDAGRTADAVAMNTFPSKGLEIYGFEFKASRADWLRELRDGSKADAVAQHCDRWFIVAPPDVVNKAELPKAWGLMIVKDGALRTSVAAPRLPGAPVRPVDRSFLAAFLRGCLRRACKPGEDDLRAARDEGVRQADEAHRAVAAARGAGRGREIHELEQQVRVFEAASGVKISAYGGQALGEDFKAFRELRANHRFGGAGHTAARMREIADQLDALGPEINRIVNGVTCPAATAAEVVSHGEADPHGSQVPAAEDQPSGGSGALSSPSEDGISVPDLDRKEAQG